MILYLLQGSKGSYDSYHTFDVGIYDSRELAQKEQDRIIAEINLECNKYTPEQKIQFEKEIREIIFRDRLDVKPLPAHLQEYSEWNFRYTFDQFNDFTITEIELNKTSFDIKNF